MGVGVGQLQSAIDGLRTEPVDEFTNLELADSLVELEGSISRLEAERCRRLSVFVERKTHRELEFSSPSAFLIDRAKITPARASRLVAQAQTLSVMAKTAQSWREGALATDQVRQLMVAQTADPDMFAANEEMLVDTVAPLGIIDCGRALDYWREVVNRDVAEADQEKLHSRRRIHLSQTFEGMFRLDGYLDPVAGEILRTALDAATAPPAKDDPRSAAQRRADGLVDLARHALDHGKLSEQGGEKPLLLVLVGAERLHPPNLLPDPHPSGVCHLGLSESLSGTVFTQSTIDLLACDCAVSRIVFGPHSQILDLGRKTRVIPASLRRAVIARDRHCQHPGCRRPAKWCDVDHIVSWLDGGATALDNLQLLCRFHHRLKHLKTGQPPPRKLAKRCDSQKPRQGPRRQ